MSDIKKLNDKLKNLKVSNGKPKSKKPTKSKDVAEEDSSPETLTELEREIQFKTELLWCQNSIKTTLETAKNDRQKESLIKGYNVLVNSKLPMVRKRQVMSQLCGDYRKKIADEIKIANNSGSQSSKIQNIATVINRDKSNNGQTDDGLNKSIFLKKHSDKNFGQQTTISSAFAESTSDFKFNFS